MPSLRASGIVALGWSGRLPQQPCGRSGERLEKEEKMISKAVIAKAAAYREAFQAAQPFKHVCIDKFFTRESADASLRDFPPFERKFAVNEYGEYGGKAVVSNISEISPFYARLYDYLCRGNSSTRWPRSPASTICTATP